MKKVTRLVVEGEPWLLLENDGQRPAGGAKHWVDVDDEVLVDPSNYFAPLMANDIGGGGTVRGESRHGLDLVWAQVCSIAPGTAAQFPLRVHFANGLGGQYKPAEVRAVRHLATLGRSAEAEYWD